MPGYARLEIARDEDFGEVTQSLPALLHVCRLNGLPGALIVSRQEAYDWRSSLRIGIGFAASRASVEGLRLAPVADHFNDGAREDVLAAARGAGIDCRIFRGEDAALAWIGASGDAAPGREEPRR
jgi:hypothetical protein